MVEVQLEADTQAAILDEKIIQTSRQASRRRLRIIVSVVAVALLAGLAVATLTLSSHLRRLKSAEQDMENARNRLSQQDMDELTAKPPSMRREQSTSPDLPISFNVEATPTEQISPNEIREKAMQALVEFERETAPRIQSEQFKRWVPSARKEDIETLQQDAVAAFEVGDYAGVLAAIELAKAQVSEQLEAREVKIRQSIEQAIQAKQAGDAVQVGLLVAEVLRLEPDHTKALQLQADNKKLPAVLTAMEAARVARIENRPEVELEYLHRALSLDPTRTELRERERVLSTSLNERNMAAAIRQVVSAIDQRDIKAARTALTKLKALDPKHDETRLLAEKIVELQQSFEVSELFKQANRQARADRWEQAVLLYSEILKRTPGQSEAIHRLGRGHQIVNLKRKIEHFLANNVHRLSVPATADIAQQLVLEARTLRNSSVSLAKLTNILQEKLKQYEREVAVRIVSDGKTHIDIRRVGYLDPLLERVVPIKPGIYTIEGRCSGYQSELMEVDIVPETGTDHSSLQTIVVICDEPL